MRRAFLFALMLSLVGGISAFPGRPPSAAAQPAKDAPKTAKSKDGKKTFTFVDREQLRVNVPGVRSLARPKTPPGVKSFGIAPPDPTPDWTRYKGAAIDFPDLGNSEGEQNCYFTASAHLAQTWTGMNGAAAVFDKRKLIAHYRQLSGGNRGLTHDQMHAEFKRGIVAPERAYKYDELLRVSPTDPDAIAMGIWGFGGLLYTCAMSDTWLNNIEDGATWDETGTPNDAFGHAMVINGKNPDGTYRLQTYGLNPPIRLTAKGLAVSRPELFVCFSEHWFDEFGVAPNGKTYKELADLWASLGGAAPPVRTFKTKPTVTLPPSDGLVTFKVGDDTFTFDPKTKIVKLAPGWGTDAPPRPGSIQDELKAAGWDARTQEGVARLYADLKAGKSTKAITDDLTGVLRALSFPPK